MSQKRKCKLKSVHKQIDSVYKPTTISIYDNVDTLTEFTVDDNVTVKIDFVFGASSQKFKRHCYQSFRI